MSWIMRKSLFHCLWLVPGIFIAGCASIHSMVCNLVEPDSYVLVSVVRCETLRTVFDYDPDTDFSGLESYAWTPAEQFPSAQGLENRQSGQVNEWLRHYIDAKLSAKGFRLDPTAPDLLVNYDVPVEMRGTLTLTFLHAGDHQLAWRGKADDEAYPARNTDAWEARIRTAVDRLLDQFPPVRRAGPDAAAAK